MKVRNQYYNLFHFSYPWTKKAWIKWNLQHLIRIPKYMFQRAKYGVCELDITDFDCAIANYIAVGLEALAGSVYGYPDTVFESDEEWAGFLADLSDDWARIADADEFWDTERENGAPYDNIAYDWAIFKHKTFEKTEDYFNNLWI